ncbi:hypothetical protein CLV58_109122 [Spirosoma oryzae]|uniref:Nucleotidase n=1 Tax=Spirosoma oryzae TaxID=1469603 RepID=A0A2T0SYA7_9BACT|nr:HAD domain-containing protein [Spirosoma oryzae]PRY38395.1 hypothetical protein CLV58_109122 [Spirosoma oryzae]
MKQYLFLDFDGVLNHELFNHDWYTRIQAGEAVAADKPDFDQRTIDNLNLLLSQFPELQVVISSTWRASGKERCLQVLRDSGFAYDERVIGCTPLTDHRVRGVEVLMWLRTNTQYGIEPVDYVIFDDDSDFLLWQADRFIQIDPYAGLTHNHVYRAGRILNRL